MMIPRTRLAVVGFSGLVLIGLSMGGRVAAEDWPLVRLAGLNLSAQKVSDSRFFEDEHRDSEEDRGLGEFLIGTRWLMYEIPGRIVEFGEDGRFHLEDWKMQGIEALWKVTGRKQVTVTVISPKFKNLTATFNFDDRLSYFTGTDLDHKRQITKSPRINMVPHDPADPYHR